MLANYVLHRKLPLYNEGNKSKTLNDYYDNPYYNL